MKHQWDNSWNTVYGQRSYFFLPLSSKIKPWITHSHIKMFSAWFVVKLTHNQVWRYQLPSAAAIMVPNNKVLTLLNNSERFGLSCVVWLLPIKQEARLSVCFGGFFLCFCLIFFVTHFLQKTSTSFWKDFFFFWQDYISKLTGLKHIWK